MTTLIRSLFKKRTNYDYLRILSVLILLFFIYICGYLSVKNTLPAPFFYDLNDTLMDFYHPLFQSLKDDKYTIWRSIYSNFSFSLLDLINFDDLCRYSSLNAFDLRECSTGSNYLIPFYYLIMISTVAFFLNYNFKTNNYGLMFVTLFLSPVSLSLLERGNLLIFVLIFLCLFFIYKKYIHLSCLFLAIAINLKIYFLYFPFIYFVKSKYAHFFWILTFFLIIYLISLLHMPDSNHLVFIKNLFGFSYDLTLIDNSRLLWGNLKVERIIFFIEKLFDQYMHSDIIFIFSVAFKITLLLIATIVLINNYKSIYCSILLLILFLLISQFIDLGLSGILLICIFLAACYRLDHNFYYFFIALMIPYDFLQFEIAPTDHYIYSWLTSSYVQYASRLNFADIIRPLIIISLFIYMIYNISNEKYKEK